jgi:hypothetical protein
MIFGNKPKVEKLKALGKGRDGKSKDLPKKGASHLLQVVSAMQRRIVKAVCLRETRKGFTSQA